ncbi:MAG: phosphonate ABC transporter ATPase, partial [Cyanobacteria bacterium CAN_BIN43]|nr:phosphonate ABC transporter ATPase [Cyanobacteria bacterium CAN_BIN43]
DLDIAQATSTNWKQRREQNGIQPEIAVEPFRTVAQALKHADVYDLLVFDGKPHSNRETLEIARFCDLVVLPTGLSLDDLVPSVLLAHELVEAKISEDKIVFALCRVGDRDNEIEEAQKYIRKAGYEILSGSIPEKSAYRRASDGGRAMSEISFPSLRQRAEEVAQAIIDRLGQKES